MLTRKTSIRVPKTDNGKKYLENQSVVYDAGDYESFALAESDIEALMPVFLEWNRRFGVLIDDCEEELIPASSVATALSILAGFASGKRDDPSGKPFEKAEMALRYALGRNAPVEIAI